MRKAFLASLRRYPATAGLMLVALVFYPAGFGLNHGPGADWFGALLSWMTATPVAWVGGQYRFLGLGETLAQGEWWRLLSPMFLHFGLLHLGFNLLWVWVIGQRIEVVNGTATLLLLITLSSLCANLTQYAMSGPGLYGGLSGVVYGLLGHAFVFSRLKPERDLGLPTGLYVFMLGFMLLGFTGVVGFLLQAGVANGAHLGGLLAGLFSGGVAGIAARLKAA